MRFSVVVAALNEGAQIAAALKRLRQVSTVSPAEIIVVDRASDDGTAEAARGHADAVLELKSSRRCDAWNAGAAAAGGDLILFLPADAHPPVQWQQALEHHWLARVGDPPAATAFSVDFGAAWPLRLLSAWSNARARRGAVSAEHGLCTSPETFRAVGGFPEADGLEDLAFCRRLAARGRVEILPARIRSAARGVHASGPLRYALGRLWDESWALAGC